MNLPTSDLPRKKKRKKRRIDNYGRETTNMLLAFGFWLLHMHLILLCLLENCERATSVCLKIHGFKNWTGLAGSTGSVIIKNRKYEEKKPKKPRKPWFNQETQNQNGQTVFQQFSNLATKQSKML